MRYALGGTFVLLVLVGAYLWALPERPHYANYPPRGMKIIAFGDSLTQGVGAEGQGYPEQVSRRLGVPIENMGVSGDTTKDALARLDRDILSESPDIVIVEFGGNDHLQKFPKEETFANLRSIIMRLEEHGIFVIVMGVRGGLLSDSWGADFERLAKDTRSLYISDILDGLFGNAKLMSDEIHPNAEGYARIADRVTPILGQVLSLIPH